MTAHDKVPCIHPNSILLSIVHSTYSIPVAVYEIEMKLSLSNNCLCRAVGHRTRTDHSRRQRPIVILFASPSSSSSLCLAHASLIRDRTPTNPPVLCTPKPCPGPVTMMATHTRNGSRNIESQTTNCSSASHHPLLAYVCLSSASSYVLRVA